MMIKILALFFSALLIQSVYASPSSAQTTSKDLAPISVMVNWNPQFQFAGFYTALHKGFYREAGLDVTIRPWDSQVNAIKQVEQQQLDFALGYSDVMVAYAQGAPLQIVMSVFQSSPLVLLSHEPVYSLQDFDQKVVAYSNQAHQIELLKERAMIERNAKIVRLPARGNLQDFIDKRVDMYAAYATNEPYRLRELGIPFHIVDPKSFDIQSYASLVFTSQKLSEAYPDRVRAFKEATIRGWNYALDHKEEVVDLILQHYPVVKSREALLNEAELSASYIRPPGVEVGNIDTQKLKNILTGVQRLGLISPQQLERINFKKMIFNPEMQAFSSIEKNYIESLKSIRVLHRTNLPPFDYIDDKGKWVGICADYYAELGRNLGIKIEPQIIDNWHDAIRSMEHSDVTRPVALSCLVPDSLLRQKLRFTDGFLPFAISYASLKPIGFIESFEDLQNQRVGVVRDDSVHRYIERFFPKLDVLTFGSVREGIAAITMGDIDGFVDNFSVLNEAIQKSGATEVRITGNLHAHLELSMAVSKDDFLLQSVLQKGLLTLSEEEKKQVLNRWFQVAVVEQMDNQSLNQALLPAKVVIAVLILMLLLLLYQRYRQQLSMEQIFELSMGTEIDLKTHTITKASHSFARFIGYSVDELQGMDYFKLRANTSDNTLMEVFISMLSGQPWRGEVTGLRKSGEVYWVDLTFSPKRNFLGQVSRVMVSRIDITDKKRIERLLIHDELTGLHNRRFYNEVIEQKMGSAVRNQHSIGYALMDIDHFKKVNDTYGHQHGDEVLQTLAKTLNSHMKRLDDYVFRIGGEEFVILTSCRNQQSFEAFLNSVRIAIEEMAILNEESVYGMVTVSIGGQCVEHEEIKGLSEDALFQRVDTALYRAKQRGRNRVEMYYPGTESDLESVDK